MILEVTRSVYESLSWVRGKISGNNGGTAHVHPLIDTVEQLGGSKAVV